MCMMAMALIGTAVQAVGAIQQGQAAASAAKANAKLYEQQAAQEKETAQIEINKERRNFRRHQGSTIASAGASGSIGFSEVFNDDLAENEVNVGIIRQGGENRAANLKSQANNERAKAKSARTAGFINAASSVFSGVSRINSAQSNRAFSLR